MSVNSAQPRAAIMASEVSPHGVGYHYNNTTQPYSCDKKCTAITLGISLPLLFLLTVGGILYIVLHRRKQKRVAQEAQNKMDEEREIALRKLGGSEVWDGRSATDAGSVKSVVEGEVERHEDATERRRD